MNRDGIPNSIFKPQRPRYIAVAEVDAHLCFADALAEAERIVRNQPEIKAHVYRIDSTVENINGVVSVRNRQ